MGRKLRHPGCLVTTRQVDIGTQTARPQRRSKSATGQGGTGTSDGEGQVRSGHATRQEDLEGLSLAGAGRKWGSQGPWGGHLRPGLFCLSGLRLG